ncbi:MAG: hypothetical protein IJ702_08560 [Fretibacterium sp.]|nr:hypothetical protein [Fretibacterium sp.]
MQDGRGEGLGLAVRNFTTLAGFWESIGGADRQCLPVAQGWERRFAEAACGMANVAGGWIVLGAEEVPDEGASPSPLRRLPRSSGLDVPEQIHARAMALLSRACNVPLKGELRLLPSERLLLVHVEPAAWHNRPVCVRRGHTLDYARGAYRRVEGVDVASGLRARFLLGIDALERLRDDRPVPGLRAQDLDAESLAAFREHVVSRRPDWAGLAPEALLSRTLVLSGGLCRVTEAGRLLLGREAVDIHVELHGGGGLDVPNLWRACALLPRLTRSLSPACGTAFRECFLNALLHADYSAGNVAIELSETAGGQVEARMENPGLVRGSEGVSVSRNFRLMRIFQLMGMARGEGTGLKLIRRYAPLFHLEQDSLELRTTAILPLEPAQDIENMPERKQPEMPLLLAAAPLFPQEPAATENPRPDSAPEVETKTAMPPSPMPEPVAEAEPAASAEPEPVLTPDPVAEPEVAAEPEPVMPPVPAPAEPEPIPEAEPAVSAEPEPVLTPDPVAEPWPDDHVVSDEERSLVEQIKALSENEQIQRISEMMDERAWDGVGREQKEGANQPPRGLFGSAEDDLRRAIAEMREAQGERLRTTGQNGTR